jgi:SAM-dependent methyltransferase
VTELKERVRAYWEAEPCNTDLASSPPGTKAFYDEVERERYRVEPFIPAFAQFERWRDRDVLEIGVGLGTDFVRFVRAGARATGVDITRASVDAVRERLALEELDANVVVADAEALPFGDGSFDLVYSWGVLHHTPETRRAVEEVRRVLRPDGEARVMLYGRRSWVALRSWLRWAALRGRPWQSFSHVLATRIESPGTKAYTPRELRRLFDCFSDVELHPFVTAYDRQTGGPVADLLGPRFGWFIGIVARP